jgi:hypothetical protein
LNYFEDKTKKANSKAFDHVLESKSINREYRMKNNLIKLNDNRIHLTKSSNSVYYHLVENLNEDFKRRLENQYNLLISDLDGFNFEFVASSLKLIYNIHSNRQESLNLFYKSFFNFYSNIKPIDLPIYRKLILFTLETLIELKEDLNELNKSNEIKLCSILENELDFYFRKDFNIRSKTNFISFFMLNEETLLKNFDFIKDKLINDILINYSI